MSPKPDSYQLNNKHATKYGRRGGKSTHALDKWYIEGECLTYPEIAARLKITGDSLYHRVTELRKLGRPLTWSDLSKHPRHLKKELENG